MHAYVRAYIYADLFHRLSAAYNAHLAALHDMCQGASGLRSHPLDLDAGGCQGLPERVERALVRAYDLDEQQIPRVMSMAIVASMMLHALHDGGGTCAQPTV